MPEVVQGNGFTFDPTNEHELTARLLRWPHCRMKSESASVTTATGIAAELCAGRFGEGLWSGQPAWRWEFRKRDLE